MAASVSSEAFLPPGAFNANMALPLNAHLHYHADASITTPSSSFPPAASHHQLPPYFNPHQSQQYSQRGRLPPASSFPLQPSDAHPLSLSSLRAVQATTANHPSSHLRINASDNPRTASVSPPRTVPVSIPDRGLPPSSTSPLSSVPQYLAGASLSRSVSADTAPPTQQTSIFMVQRLVQQNTLIREAWEAERNYLETNRRRAEEVYQEERAIMDDVREGWESEKTTMQREIESLKERLHRLEGENSTLKAVTAQSIQMSGVISPMGSQRGGSGDASMESSYFSAPPGRLTSRPQHPAMPTSFSMIDDSSLPPGLDGASRRPHFRSPGSARLSPTTMSHSTFAPMDPRMQPQNSIAKDFLSSPSDDSEAPIPIIDVQEIDPQLEGIPIKATAVQRSTFALGGSPPENPSSPATSPPLADAAQYTEEQSRRPPGVRGSSKQYTMQALAAVESRRLTMHAGHTPNHSLSLFPTVTATETNSIVGISEGATPTAEIALDIPVYSKEPDSNDDEDTPTHTHGLEDVLSDSNLDQPTMEPDEDKPLKGPLMIKNIPAQDEIFWEAVNKKLTPISRGENALPSVMQTSPDDLESISDLGVVDSLSQRRKAPLDPIGVDGSNDAHTNTDDDTCEFGDGKNVEADIPLKFKTTSNFGAPFGAAFGKV